MAKQNTKSFDLNMLDNVGKDQMKYQPNTIQALSQKKGQVPYACDRETEHKQTPVQK